MSREAEATELLQRIARRDEKALAAFYRSFEHSIYRYASLRLNDSHEAADILNEVMLDIWNGAGRFAGRSKVSTWVLGITRHKVMDRLRKLRPELTSLDAEGDVVDTGVTDPAAHAVTDDDATVVRRCLARLSDAHREIVYLTYYEELSYPEIAVIADCPEGTVKTRMFHARRALRRCVETLTRATESGRP